MVVIDSATCWWCKAALSEGHAETCPLLIVGLD